MRRRLMLAALSLAHTASALKCVKQLSASEEDWEIEECSTFCMVAFARSTLYESFTQPNPICGGAGCAVLDSQGEIDLSKTVFGSNDYPAYGKVEIYGCTNQTFAEFPQALEAKYENGDPCNLYRDYTASTQVCQYLPEELKVFELERSLFERHRFAFILGICLFLGLILTVVGFLYYRHRVAEKRKVDKADASSTFSGNEEADMEAAQMSPIIYRDEGLEELPSHLAPGSAAYERYHEALTAIYKEAGQDTSRVDNILQQYLARPNGIEILNKKLKQRFGKQLKKFKPQTALQPPQETTSQSFY